MQRYFAECLSPASLPLLPPSSKRFLSEPRASEHGRGFRELLRRSKSCRQGWALRDFGMPAGAGAQDGGSQVRIPVPRHLRAPAAAEGAREGEPAPLWLDCCPHTKKSTSGSLQKSSLRVVLRFGENQRQKEMAGRLRWSTRRQTNPVGFLTCFS